MPRAHPNTRLLLKIKVKLVIEFHTICSQEKYPSYQQPHKSFLISGLRQQSACWLYLGLVTANYNQRIRSMLTQSYLETVISRCTMTNSDSERSRLNGQLGAMVKINKIKRLVHLSRCAFGVMREAEHHITVRKEQRYRGRIPLGRRLSGSMSGLSSGEIGA